MLTALAHQFQLPARDTRKSDKAAEKARADELRGRRLRETKGGEAQADEDATTLEEQDRTGSEKRA